MQLHQPQISKISPCIFLEKTTYFILFLDFWMFCEGFYLHTLLVYAFTQAESKLLKGFYVFGWIVPSIPVTLYALFRSTDGDHNEQKE